MTWCLNASATKDPRSALCESLQSRVNRVATVRLWPTDIAMSTTCRNQPHDILSPKARRGESPSTDYAIYPGCLLFCSSTSLTQPCHSTLLLHSVAPRYCISSFFSKYVCFLVSRPATRYPRPHPTSPRSEKEDSTCQVLPREGLLRPTRGSMESPQRC